MIEERYYQPQAVSCLVDSMFAKRGNALVALPTGTGKSIVIVLFFLKLIELYFPTRVLCLTHSLELVEQNAKKFRTIAPHIPMGINCDGLNKRDFMQPVIFGSIGSVITMAAEIAYRDVILIDEAHRVNDDEDGMYSRFIIAMRIINPKVLIVGLTATPYDNYGPIVRYDEQGRPTSLFSHFAYSRISPEDFQEFIARGWLSPLIAKSTETKYNLKEVGIQAGDFNQKQLQKATDVEILTRQAVAETIHIANIDNRNCGLVFSNGIKHAEHIAEEFQAQGETAVFVHSKMSKKKRDDALDCFHAAEAKYMVNNGILTTGYDHPPIDIMAVIRMTCSLPLWAQILGRLTRPYDWQNPQQYIPGFEYTKRNGLVLDFACNTERLGPIDAPYFKKPKKGEPGDAPVKICPMCEVYNYASARFCNTCDHEFKFEVKYEGKAGVVAPMSNGETEIQITWHDVTFVNYDMVQTKSSPPMLKVIYNCGYHDKFSEVVCLEHKSGARSHAWGWWVQRTNKPVPSLVEDALKVTHELKRPLRIAVERNPASKYPKVKEYEFEQRIALAYE